MDTARLFKLFLSWLTHSAITYYIRNDRFALKEQYAISSPFAVHKVELQAQFKRLLMTTDDSFNFLPDILVPSVQIILSLWVSF